MIRKVQSSVNPIVFKAKESTKPAPSVVFLPFDPTRDKPALRGLSESSNIKPPDVPHADLSVIAENIANLHLSPELRGRLADTLSAIVHKP